MNAHRALIRAIAQNADPRKAQVVLSQAVNGLRVEADLLTTLHESNPEDVDLSTAIYALAGRLRALESFVHCLLVDYHPSHEDSFAFDGEEPAESEGAPCPG